MQVFDVKGISVFDRLRNHFRTSKIEIRDDIDPNFTKRVRAIDWDSYHTAYGRADKVPVQLLKLASPDNEKAINATHDLWCGLCHQHVQMGTAALPAIPFILEVLDVASEELTVEILDILLGFALGSNRQRSIDYQIAIGHKDPLPEPEWIAETRSLLIEQRERFEQLKTHKNSDIKEFSVSILEEFVAD
jgi:hypothetical protein